MQFKLQGIFVCLEKLNRGSELFYKTTRLVYNKSMKKEDIRSQIKLKFSKDRSFFGKGTVMLLEEIDKCGNVRTACENCGFSYSKGWTILKRCEGGLGYKIVERHQGGKSGGKAEVTDEGRKLMMIYKELLEETSDYAEKRFREMMAENGLSVKGE